MADKKISELTAATALTVGGVDILPIVQAGETKKISVATLTSVLDVSGTLDVAGATTLAGLTATSLSVPTGTVTSLSADTVTVGTSLTVPTATLTGDLGVVNVVASGDVSAVNGTFTGDVGIVGAISGASVNVSGAVVGGSLDIGIDAAIGGALGVIGAITGNSLSTNVNVVTVDVTATGAIDCNSLTSTTSVGANTISATTSVSTDAVNAATVSATGAITGDSIAVTTSITGASVTSDIGGFGEVRLTGIQTVDDTADLDPTVSTTYVTNTLVGSYSISVLATGATEGHVHVIAFSDIGMTVDTLVGSGWTSISPNAAGATATLMYLQSAWYILSTNDVVVT